MRCTLPFFGVCPCIYRRVPLQVRHMLAETGRLRAVRQVIVNPSDEALWNLMSACSNTGAPLFRLARLHHAAPSGDAAARAL